MKHLGLTKTRILLFLADRFLQIRDAKQKQPSRGVLRKRCSEKCSKFTGEEPCGSVISIKLHATKNTSGRLLLAKILIQLDM